MARPGRPIRGIRGLAIAVVNAVAMLAASSPAVADQPTVPAPTPPAKVIQLAAGGGFTCARLADATVHCWGANSHGELGDGTTTPSRPGFGGHRGVGRPRPARATAVGPTTAIALGSSHACALRPRGGVQCWGNVGFGQRGVADERTGLVAGLIGVVEIVAGERATCARLAGGKGRCWGNNQYGQLGDRGDASGGEPVRIQVASGIAQLAVGDWHACARASAGAVTCWGGDHASSPRRRAARILGVKATQIVAGGLETCAVERRGRVLCWAPFVDDPAAAKLTITPTVIEIPAATAVAVGARHACALLTDRRVACWGSNMHGQLGVATEADSVAPAIVPGLTDVRQLALGSLHSCALRGDGAVVCWGNNDGGQLGDGTFTERHAPAPVQW